jgi:Cu/Ag efflux protein CusF
MKALTATSIAAIFLLSACGPKAETKAPATTMATATSGQPDAMPVGDPASNIGKMVKGTGIVTAVDAKAGTMTLDHDPIPAAGWPAMTMAFKAPAAVIAAAKTGEKVAFDIRIEDQGGSITAIEKQ